MKKEKLGKDIEELVSIIRQILSEKGGCVKAKQEERKDAYHKMKGEKTFDF